MCHAVPAKVTDILDGERVRIDLSGITKTVSTALVGDVAVGEYLLVHVGYALGRIDPEEAEATLAQLDRIGALS